MPEFLTERNWQMDFYQCPIWVIGADHQTVAFRNIIQNLLDSCCKENKISSSKILWTTTMEAESIKYTRNCFLATKVGFFNEIWTFCKTMGIDFETVRQGVISDPRIGPSHSHVPNEEVVDGKTISRTGFSGHCLPKDTRALIQQFAQKNIPSPILNAVWDRNLHIDRPERDWENDKGRAVVE
jgi:UDPglucose 6-dehydrogenase